MTSAEPRAFASDLKDVPVLVVDDDVHLRRTLSDILSLRGYEPLTAENGAGGLRIAEDRTADLAVALVDLRLPDMNGIELVERIHALSQLTEVIILTGHASVDSAVDALRHETFDYLVKPVHPENLLQTLRGATDRWQRRVMEQRLMDTEERFRLLVENISDTILVAGPDGRVVYASPSVKRMLDRDADEVLGMPFAELIHPDDRARVAALLAGGPSGAVPRTLEHRLRRRDGSWLPVESTVNDRSDEPRVGGVVVASRDVRDRKQLEAQLLHAQKMESVGRLAGGIAHDFNNLLTVILGATNVALADLAGDRRASEPLSEVLRAGERAAQLTAQLLAFSRQQVLQPRVIDLNEMVAGVEGMLRRVLPQSIELIVDCERGLWPVRADPTQIEQVLMNLVVNARDAMPRGGRLTIRTVRAPGGERTRRAGAPLAGDHVVLEVTDTGDGIPAELQERIFDPFFTTKPVGKGTGLGLATVHGIVEQSGGVLRLWSAVGEGTTIEVLLPRSLEGVTPRPAADAAPVPGGSESILVVEDESQVRDLVSATLTRQGYRVTPVASGEEALRRVEGGARFDLVLTDLGLPGMTGRALARRLAEDAPELRVVLMSGHMAEGSDPAGAWDETHPFLRKPFTPVELLRFVRSELDRPPPSEPRASGAPRI